MSTKRLKPLDELTHHPVMEKLANIIQVRARNTDTTFFRIQVVYYFAVMAALQRTTINSPLYQEIPVNIYAINLSPSGSGKGVSCRIMEREVIKDFLAVFRDHTMPLLVEQNLPKEALKRASRNGNDPDEEHDRLKAEYAATGPFLPIFDSATEAALKQARHKLQLAKAGSLNLQIDEIGTNLSSNAESLGVYLQMYDTGDIKPKYTKNSVENKRAVPVTGSTPTNMLLFGTPTKLFDGDKTEAEFIQFLDTGYARRCLFGFTSTHGRLAAPDVEDLYDQLTNTDTDAYMDELNLRFGRMADVINTGRELMIEKDTELLILEYQSLCNQRADAMSKFAQLGIAEMSHRYFKALKLSGVFAFIDDTNIITSEHVEHAIHLVEESGHSFDQLLTQDGKHVTLARFIAESNRPLTQADLVESLPFYRGNATALKTLMNLAISYGYKNNIIIQRSYESGVEFLEGETIKETDLNDLVVSYSTDIVRDYVTEPLPWNQLHVLTQQNGFNWVNHRLVDGYRDDDHVIEGFDLLVLDVDNGFTIEMCQHILADYRYHLHTTKSHSPSLHRYRIVIPLSHRLVLDTDSYNQFMEEIYQYIPLELDYSTKDRCRKWASCPGTYEYNEGKLFDVLPFIPNTSRNDEHVQRMKDQADLDNLERWFVNNTGKGNRNQNLVRYALLLTDAGYTLEEVRTKVLEVNSQLYSPITEKEIAKTVMVTAAKRLNKRP